MPSAPSRRAVLPDLEKACSEDKVYAFEVYIDMYHCGFKSATTPRPHGWRSSRKYRHQIVQECRERLKKPNHEVSIAASRGDTDAMLELGLRVGSGTHLNFQQQGALRLFEKIVVEEGHSPQNKAIAASLSCYCGARALFEESDDEGEKKEGAPFAMSVFSRAEISCRYGLFSHACLDLVVTFDRFNLDYHLHGPFSSFRSLWGSYDSFRQFTGMQRPKAKNCARCGRRPPRRCLLKKCAGPCYRETKPVYCNSECQRADWSRHRRYCVYEDEDEPEETDSDIAYSDSEPVPESQPPPDNYDIPMIFDPPEMTSVRRKKTQLRRAR